MKRFFERFLIMAVLLMSGSMPAQADERLRIVVYGDSLTSGYGMQPEQSYAAKLERKLKETGFTDVDVINMSRPGESAGGGVDRLDSLLAQRPDIVVLELGSDDALRGIRIEVIHANLGAIVTRLLEKNVYVILLGMKAPSNMGPIYSSRFEEIYRNTAGHYKLPLYPYLLDSIYGRPDMNMADGYHPNAKGMEVMVDYTYPLVDSAVRWKQQVQQYQKDMRPENEPLTAPEPPPGMPR